MSDWVYLTRVGAEALFWNFVGGHQVIHWEIGDAPLWNDQYVSALRCTVTYPLGPDVNYPVGLPITSLKVSSVHSIFGDPVWSIGWPFTGIESTSIDHDRLDNPVVPPPESPLHGFALSFTQTVTLSSPIKLHDDAPHYVQWDFFVDGGYTEVFPIFAEGNNYFVDISILVGSSAPPPLRMRQRDDGLGIQGHSRLNQQAHSGSTSVNTGIRLHERNTYT